MFEIAAVPLERGTLGVAPLPGHESSLATDVETIRDWGAAAVVSMTPTEEMQRLGAQDLPIALDAAGIIWHALPITDFGAPQAASDAQWANLSRALHAELDAGRKVLLHCRGGRGRSGMVALRLMVERGVDPASALAELRTLRPGAVETEAQLAWATAGVP
ncbi:Cyclin-dependent kinase inhibitor 3 (CDKN3) [Aliiruegeria haliotis]|uniref:protein-tyrosine-phosphatase n=1 Tax=Aliiruegeria haliotis TaxID=1280846 RepID=A0A2T0RVA9_9RHOB|nr:protein-tyrosine phosphatase family protein [Aliiruegeria haliotis]PRY25062.1 Cyclin-dependent kinase inhibitor 3 (CDKN3) [Aliiruegeria haliotis]